MIVNLWMLWMSIVHAIFKNENTPENNKSKNIKCQNVN